MKPAARILLALAAASAAALSASCSTYTDYISASSEEKRAAYALRVGEWGGSGSPRLHGRERSVQVFRGEGISVTADGMRLGGGIGLASIISEDGYALTAAHVVARRPALDTILAPVEAEAGAGDRPVHVQWGTVTITARDGTVMSRDERLMLIGYGPGIELFGPGDVETRRVRVVEVWPSHDLALVKLPVRARRWFELREDWPSVGDVIFASGNGGTPYRGTSAGEIVALRGKPAGLLKTLHTSIPLAAGDSGGPVFDPDGKLVGIVSRVRPSRLLPWPKMGHSTMEMVAAPEVRRLVEEDRRRARSSGE